jgi:hypothetical protein
MINHLGCRRRDLFDLFNRRREDGRVAKGLELIIQLVRASLRI